ncbi:three component ABC system middle component [Frondihabitans australicus]|uniref:Uncharacterized protein n=1 Tax=Frondihabitans australicus TaxID=386892 RepID=A0A495IMA1_9MICO|nr:three component ABC system middle component [Frondihabitans australicus]RKR76296.1 hypothetical protein C8E83_3464 [Frondihabitans australicus]
MTDAPPRTLDGLPHWENRSHAAAAMLNPALIAALIAAAAYRHAKHSGELMPWELSFLVAPMALHGGTRDVVPVRITSNLPRWVQENPVIHAGIGRRAASLAPYVREGLRWGLNSGSLELTDGRLRGTIRDSIPKSNSDELRSIMATAGFLGRWFAHVGSVPTVFAVLGVTP